MNRRIYKAQWEVPSHTKDKTYKVSEKWTGQFVCSCPHNIFRKVECDHIKEAKAFEQERSLVERMLNRLRSFGIERIA
jgi:hypothetical protein